MTAVVLWSACRQQNCRLCPAKGQACDKVGPASRAGRLATAAAARGRGVMRSHPASPPTTHVTSSSDRPRTVQDAEYSEVSLVLRLPRWRPQPPPAAASGAGPPRRPAGDTALGVDGIELREQSHEEALLSTIGARPGCQGLGSGAEGSKCGPIGADWAGGKAGCSVLWQWEAVCVQPWQQTSQPHSKAGQQVRGYFRAGGASRA